MKMKPMLCDETEAKNPGASFAAHARTAAVNAQRAGGGKLCHAMLARASDAEAVRGAAAMAEQGWAMPARPRGPWSMWQTWMHQPSQAMRGTV